MTKVNVTSQAPTIVDFHADEAPEFDVTREDESGDVILTITTGAHDQARFNIGRFYDSAEGLRNALQDVVDDMDANILAGWEDTPDPESDAWISEGRGRYGNGYFIQLEGVAVGDKERGYVSRDIATFELAEAMAKAGCFPNAWYENERGNVDNIGEDVRKYHDEGGTAMIPLEGVEYDEGQDVTYDNDDYIVVRDYGQFGVVIHRRWDESSREHVTDRSEITTLILCRHCGDEIEHRDTTDIWYSKSPQPGMAPGFCDQTEDQAHEPESD